MISNMHFAGEDKKVRKYLLPKAVIYKAGGVSGEAGSERCSNIH